MPDSVRVAVAPGLGDNLWSLTKFAAVLREAGARAAHVLVSAGVHQRAPITRRAVDFLAGFSFVGGVEVTDLPLHPPGDYWDEDGCFYLPSGRVPVAPGVDYRVVANGALERGVPLADFLPEYATDFGVLRHYRTPPAPGLREALDGLGRFAVVYTSCRGAYLPGGGGFNRHDDDYPAHWSLADWSAAAAGLRERLGLPVALVGAAYDGDAAAELCARDPALLNWCGRHAVADTVEVLRRAAVVVGYPSGVPILAAYLGRPTVMFYNTNPVLRENPNTPAERVLRLTPGFTTAWVPPAVLESGSYKALRFGYHGPDDVFAAVDDFRRRGLL